MGGIRNIFGGPSLGKIIHSAQRKMAAEDFDQAHKIVAKGLQVFADAEPLKEMELTIRRAQARAGIQSLKTRIEREGDPRAYEQLIALYLELGLFAEARHEAMAYAAAHPDRDTAHLVLGEMSLQSFFEDLRAPDAHVAQRRLTRAASLNPQAVKSRLLLAELYFCVGADHQLSGIVSQLKEIAQDDPLLEPLLEKIGNIPEPNKPLPLDGIFERVEVRGSLEREPTTWPLGTRRTRVNRLDEDRALRAAQNLVVRGSPAEVVLIQRGGTLVAHAATPDDDVPDSAADASKKGLINVTRTVARTVSRHAREFDMGAFKRCTIQGPFGLVTIGEIGGVVTGARWRTSPDAERRWERVSLHLEGTLGGKR